jgi:hypothetical protein
VAADSAGDAADSQSQATKDANAVTQGQYAQTRADLSPYRQLGADSTSKLATLLGTAQNPDFASPAANAEVQRLAQQRAQDRAVQQVASGWNLDPAAVLNRPDAMAEVARLTNMTGADRAGAYSQVQAGWGNPAATEDYGSLLKNFTGKDLANEPGYQFGLAEGQKGIDRRLQSGGNYFSGAALKAAGRFGNDYASTKFGDAFNRDAANKTRIYNFLQGGTSLGENAAAQTGNAGSNMAQQVGANTTAMGSAMGASQIAQGNAWSSGINNAYGGYQQNELMKKILGGNSSWGGSSSGSTNSGAYGLDGSNGAYWN